MQAATTAVMLGVLAVTYLLLLKANAIFGVIGKNGASILTRVMGMILAALSVELVLEALNAEKWIPILR